MIARLSDSELDARIRLALVLSEQTKRERLAQKRINNALFVLAASRALTELAERMGHTVEEEEST